jgi:hypothetical protein
VCVCVLVCVNVRALRGGARAGDGLRGARAARVAVVMGSYSYNYDPLYSELGDAYAEAAALRTITNRMLLSARSADATVRAGMVRSAREGKETAEAAARAELRRAAILRRHMTPTGGGGDSRDRDSDRHAAAEVSRTLAAQTQLLLAARSDAAAAAAAAAASAGPGRPQAGAKTRRARAGPPPPPPPTRTFTPTKATAPRLHTAGRAEVRLATMPTMPTAVSPVSAPSTPRDSADSGRGRGVGVGAGPAAPAAPRWDAHRTHRARDGVGAGAGAGTSAASGELSVRLTQEVDGQQQSRLLHATGPRPRAADGSGGSKHAAPPSLLSPGSTSPMSTPPPPHESHGHAHAHSHGSGGVGGHHAHGRPDEVAAPGGHAAAAVPASVTAAGVGPGGTSTVSFDLRVHEQDRPPAPAQSPPPPPAPAPHTIIIQQPPVSHGGCSDATNALVSLQLLFWDAINRTLDKRTADMTEAIVCLQLMLQDAVSSAVVQSGGWACWGVGCLLAVTSSPRSPHCGVTVAPKDRTHTHPTKPLRVYRECSGANTLTPSPASHRVFSQPPPPPTPVRPSLLVAPRTSAPPPPSPTHRCRHRTSGAGHGCAHVLHTVHHAGHRVGRRGGHLPRAGRGPGGCPGQGGRCHRGSHRPRAHHAHQPRAAARACGGGSGAAARPRAAGAARPRTAPAAAAGGAAGAGGNAPPRAVTATVAATVATAAGAAAAGALPRHAHPQAGFVRRGGAGGRAAAADGGQLVRRLQPVCRQRDRSGHPHGGPGVAGRRPGPKHGPVRGGGVCAAGRWVPGRPAATLRPPPPVAAPFTRPQPPAQTYLTHWRCCVLRCSCCAL